MLSFSLSLALFLSLYFTLCLYLSAALPYLLSFHLETTGSQLFAPFVRLKFVIKSRINLSSE